MPKFISSLQKDKTGLNKSFDVFVKKGKSFERIASGLTEGRALKFGSSNVMKNLRATFSIKQSGYTTEQDIAFSPSTKFFREYKIAKGQRIATPGTFIQEARTRLSSSTEKSEIQTARKLKLKPLVIMR